MPELMSHLRFEAPLKILPRELWVFRLSRLGHLISPDCLPRMGDLDQRAVLRWRSVALNSRDCAGRGQRAGQMASRMDACRCIDIGTPEGSGKAPSGYAAVASAGLTSDGGSLTTGAGKHLTSKSLRRFPPQTCANCIPWTWKDIFDRPRMPAGEGRGESGPGRYF